MLPATTLAGYCYYAMFSGCAALTIAPELPATALASNCYNGMFNSCKSLTTAPMLPATTLVSSCYDSMFYGCTSLSTAPELPATTLTFNCYSSMFRDCTALTSITVGFSAWNPSNATTYWLSGVSSTGTFYCPSALPTTRGINNIPNNWDITNTDIITVDP